MPLVAGGSTAAFELVYDRHGAAAFSLAYRMVGNRAAAEDIVQEAFLSVWRARTRYEARRGSVRSWVLELAYFAGFTHSQIAEMLDMPIGTVKGRMRLLSLIHI